MSKRLKDNITFLRYLASANNKGHLCRILASASKEQVNTLSEIAANIVFGNIPLTTAHRKAGAKYEVKITAIADGKKSVRKRQDLLIRAPKVVLYLLLASKPFLNLLSK
jgi:hypothetical protein